MIGSLFNIGLDKLSQSIGSWLGLNLSPADLQAAAINNEYAKEADERSFQYQLRGLRESPQSQIEGFEAAGLNPAMMYGSTNPTYAEGQGTAASATNSTPQGLSAIVAPLLELAMAKSRLDLTNAQVENTEADTGKKKAEAEGQGYQNTITQSTMDAVIRAKNMEPDKLQADINYAIKLAKTEEEKQGLIALQKVAQDLSNEQFAQLMPLVVEAQNLQNEYQKFVNNHQEDEFNARMDKIDAEISSLLAKAHLDLETAKYAGDKTPAQVLGSALRDLIAVLAGDPNAPTRGYNGTNAANDMDFWDVLLGPAGWLAPNGLFSPERRAARAARRAGKSGN